MTLQNPAHPSLQAIALGAEFSDLEEGARYALLQRLAPALQHHMMGKFQSMDMIAAMMERRLKSADPDLASIREDCASLSSVSRIAVRSIMDLMTWIEPKAASTLSFDAGVVECLGLLSTEFRFKGFVIVNEAREIDVKLSSRALRSVLSAALIALSDLSKVSATLVIQAQAMPDSVELTIDLRPTERDTKRAYVTDSRALKWRDVEILALAESVQLERGDTGAQLTFALPAANADLPGDLFVGTGI
ncbi:hypothetical protein [Polaromonas hydrogenivorans]|uniref:Histidine kinase n=1 Tax=Polaromonas hydrogenivorans TaxID=335476 RepID=A0AAU7LUJ6_9BURK